MFDEKIEQIVVDADGNILEGIDAFDLDVAKEYKKDAADRNFIALHDIRIKKLVHARAK